MVCVGVYSFSLFIFFILNFYSQLILCFAQLFWSTFCLFSLCIFQLKIQHITHTNSKTKSISIQIYHPTCSIPHHNWSKLNSITTPPPNLYLQRKRKRKREKNNHTHLPWPNTITIPLMGTPNHNWIYNHLDHYM